MVSISPILDISAFHAGRPPGLAGADFASMFASHATHRQAIAIRLLPRASPVTTARADSIICHSRLHRISASFHSLQPHDFYLYISIFPHARLALISSIESAALIYFIDTIIFITAATRATRFRPRHFEIELHSYHHALK